MQMVEMNANMKVKMTSDMTSVSAAYEQLKRAQAILNTLLQDRSWPEGEHQLSEALTRIAQAQHALLDVREQFVRREFADCLAASALPAENREAAISGDVRLAG